MRELKYGSQMRDYTCGNGDSIKWIFSENVHIDKDTLYEVEYTESNNSDPSDFSCIYNDFHICNDKGVVTTIQRDIDGNQVTIMIIKGSKQNINDTVYFTN